MEINDLYGVSKSHWMRLILLCFSLWFSFFLWLGCAYDTRSISGDYAVQRIKGFKQLWKGVNRLVLCKSKWQSRIDESHLKFDGILSFIYFSAEFSISSDVTTASNVTHHARKVRKAERAAMKLATFWQKVMHQTTKNKIQKSEWSKLINVSLFPLQK